jgi:uncharacterized protein with HEPN domain
VIGEAAGRVSPEFREAHSEIPWALITGMRNRLAHEYGHVDVFEVRIVAIRDCPKLVVRLEELVPDSADGLPEEWEFL